MPDGLTPTRCQIPFPARILPLHDTMKPDDLRPCWPPLATLSLCASAQGKRHPQEPGRAPAESAEDRGGQQDADGRPVRGARQPERRLLHRCRGQLPAAGPADRHPQPQQPDRRADREKLSAVDFKSLPFKDSFTIVRGNGKRRIAIFEDPNCGYCKRFEKDLAKIDNVTVHVFPYPVLGPDSQAKSQAIWCARTKARAFEDWMLRNVAPAAASCDTSAIQRNLALGQKTRHRHADQFPA